MSTYDDVIAGMKADIDIASIAGDRIYKRQVLREKENAFITIIRSFEKDTLVEQVDRIRVTMFSKDLAELDNLSGYVRTFFNSKQRLNSNDNYVKFVLVAGSDSETRLLSGHYYSEMIFKVNKIY